MKTGVSHEWIRQGANEGGHIERPAQWGVANMQEVKGRWKRLRAASASGTRKMNEEGWLIEGKARSSCGGIPRGWYTCSNWRLTWWVFSSARKLACSVSQKNVLHALWVSDGHEDITAFYTEISCHSQFVFVSIADYCVEIHCVCVLSGSEVYV